MHEQTYWPAGQIPVHDAARVIGTKCVNCRTMLTAENLAGVTDKVGVCRVCRPPAFAPGMVAPQTG